MIVKGVLAAKYRVDLTPDRGYVQDYEDGEILVGGNNPNKKNQDYSTLGDFTSRNHPYPTTGVLGTHGTFQAVAGITVDIVSEALWAPGTVDAGFVPLFS